ncbi:hypothetical protein SASPL_103489 [Salvia splendens]|uniref:Uncharacterized protein n=1 Tax=Salvia splendens TaxID=180675 RepID=A0A8X8YJT0_SALSN|nr:hypothetical protein SASPL_103489 [Salvia splendens]
MRSTTWPPYAWNPSLLTTDPTPKPLLLTLSPSAFVYLAILRCHTLTNSHLLAFLHSLRDQFTNIASSTNTLDNDHFAPAACRLVASLERLSEGGGPTWPNMNGAEAAGTSSTKAPLLARPCKQDKWCRQVRTVLAIDAAVCVVLLVIWLVICKGLECIR